MNKGHLNHRIPPLCFHLPNMRKDGMKGSWERSENYVKEITAKQRNVWYRLGLWRWSTQPNVCVCDKTGVNLSSEAESKYDFFLLANMFYCCFPARAPQPSISPTSIVCPHPFIRSSFWKTILLIWILLKENVHTFIQATARRVCLWNALSQILRFCLNKQSNIF